MHEGDKVLVVGDTRDVPAVEAGVSVAACADKEGDRLEAEKQEAKVKAYNKTVRICARMGVLVGARFRDSKMHGTFRSGKAKMSKKERRAMKDGRKSRTV